MKDVFKNKNTSILIPAFIGAAAAGAITYLLIADDTAELRNKLAGTLEKGFDSLKEQFSELEQFSAIKEQLLEKFADNQESINAPTATTV